MTDLEWLARNVHQWPSAGCALSDIYARRWALVASSEEPDFIGRWNVDEWYSKEQWQAERERIQGKPARWLYPFTKWRRQIANGRWYEYDADPTKDPKRSGWGVGEGEVLGNWRDTLERRPAAVIDHAAVETCVKEFSRMLREAHASQIKQRCSGADTSDDHDPVEKPSHYCLLPGVEAYHVRHAILSKPEVADIPPGEIDDWSRAWEYLTRCFGKNGLEDLKKGRWYLNKLIEKMEARQ